MCANRTCLHKFVSCFYIDSLWWWQKGLQREVTKVEKGFKLGNHGLLMNHNSVIKRFLMNGALVDAGSEKIHCGC